MKTHTRIISCGLIWFLSVSQLACPVSATDWSFSVQFDKSIREAPYSGRVYLFFSKTPREPRQGPGWFSPEPFASQEVKDLAPGQKVTLTATDPDLLFYLEKPRQFDPAGYRVQAVMRFDTWSREVGTGAGNGYSAALNITEEGTLSDAHSLVIDHIVPTPTFVETETVKLCQVESPLLSKFYDRPVLLNAAVMLPAEYQTDPQRHFPTLFIIPGFSGTHHGYQRQQRAYPALEKSLPTIKVLLDPSCPEGHHVFADSKVNGPWGTVLVEEFLPQYEAQFRAIPHREARYLTGHSSGGWSSLWLMVNHPEVFAATWSTAPDPVTFRDFQQIDMYAAEENMYDNRSGERRPLARIRGEVRVWYSDFDRMETVLGHGGQLRSFEAVFGNRRENGTPEPAWNRETGLVNSRTTEHWRKYDIVEKIEREWDALEPHLSGRLHVHMGEQDTFYLEGATRLLQQSLTALGEPKAVIMHPERTHMNLLTSELKQQISQEITGHYRKYFDANGRTLAPPE